MKTAAVSTATDEILVLEAPLSGWAAPLDEVPDPVFAERMLGDGLAIDPLDECLRAPCAGLVVSLPATRHAVTLRATNGAEILMHVGLETVALAGEGFQAHVVEGQSVRRGDVLLTFDLDAIARRARSLITPIVLTNGEGFEILSRVTGREVRQGEAMLELRPLAAAGTDARPIGAALSADVTVTLPHGLHARPAARLVAALRDFEARIEVRHGDRGADARSAVSLMALGASAGATLAVQAEGPDAAAALKAFSATLASLAREEAAETTPQVAAVPTPTLPAESPPGALRGLKAAPGLAIGVAVRLHAPEPTVRTEAEAPELERRQLRAALTEVEAAVRAQAAAGDRRRRDILAAHQAFLDDPHLRRGTDAKIAAGFSAGVAWRDTVQAQVAVLRSLTDPRLALRADDLVDLQRQVLLALMDEPPAAIVLPPQAVVIADELLPSQLVAMEDAQPAGFCTARSGATSHVAILAAAMGIPALCAMGSAVLKIKDGTTVILDADAGLLRVAPDQEVLAATQATLDRREERRRRERTEAMAPGRLADGARVEVLANLGSVREADAAVALGAEGCGLFRTEFLYLDRAEAPGEDEQLAAYQAAADGMGDRLLVIRTLDAGGDKPLAFAPAPHETNPALGLRGIRASLRRPDLMRAQLSAILRVTGPGERRILLPMINDLDELRAVRRLADDLAAGLGLDRPKLGVMIETPAAALLADQLAREADFLSIGTNDLTQYVLAVDREHPELAPSLDGLHPAVLRLIAQAADAGRHAGRTVSVCGGLASDPLAAPALVGLGVGVLSAAPAAIPGLKSQLRGFTLQVCEDAARAALALSSAREVRALLHERFCAKGDSP